MHPCNVRKTSPDRRLCWKVSLMFLQVYGPIERKQRISRFLCLKYWYLALWVCLVCLKYGFSYKVNLISGQQWWGYFPWLFMHVVCMIRGQFCALFWDRDSPEFITFSGELSENQLTLFVLEKLFLTVDISRKKSWWTRTAEDIREYVWYLAFDELNMSVFYVCATSLWTHNSIWAELRVCWHLPGKFEGHVIARTHNEWIIQKFVRK